MNSLVNTFGTYLDRLLACHWLRTLTGEDALSQDVAAFLRKETSNQRLTAVWTHIGNEGKRTPAQGAKLKAMGMIPGAADFVFNWSGGGGYIELKTEKGTLQRSQKDYRTWCFNCGVDYRICRSVEEVRLTLLEWGVLAEARN